MSDVLSEFAIHVSTGAALGPVAGEWHRKEADWRERELRDFMAAMGAELRLVKTDDPERRAIIDALLKAHPALTQETVGAEPR